MTKRKKANFATLTTQLALGELLITGCLSIVLIVVTLGILAAFAPALPALFVLVVLFSFLGKIGRQS